MAVHKGPASSMPRCTRSGSSVAAMPVYPVYLYWPKFLHVIFCFWSYTWAAQLIRREFHLDISFIYWFGVIRSLLYVSFSVHSWRSQWSRRQGVRRYNSWCTDMSQISAPYVFIYLSIEDHVEIHYFKHMTIRNARLSDTRLKELCYHFTTLFEDKTFLRLHYKLFLYK
jgi:hypothetical protein